MEYLLSNSEPEIEATDTTDQESGTEDEESAKKEYPAYDSDTFDDEEEEIMYTEADYKNQKKSDLINEKYLSEDCKSEIKNGSPNSVGNITTHPIRIRQLVTLEDQKLSKK